MHSPPVALLTSSYDFDDSTADIVISSSALEAKPRDFCLHSCILIMASSFFKDMFSLPQPSSSKMGAVHLQVSEYSSTLDTLFRFVYPVMDPIIETLDEFSPVLEAAVKYDFISTISHLRKMLVEPRFLQSNPLRVFAIAARYDFTEEVKISSRATLSVDIVSILLNSPLTDDLRHITAHTYRRLLDLHRRRACAAQELLKLPHDVKCQECNCGHAIYNAPKWWYEWMKRAKEELSLRPCTAVIFRTDFLAQAAAAVRFPHIGHLYSLVISDIFARYNRLKNPSIPVRYVTGTDEHGLKIQKAAAAKGMDPKEFCDQTSEQFRRLSSVADITHTTFVRTSEEAHYKSVQHIWRELDALGLIYKSSYSGWYSVTDECFYTESQVTEIPATADTPSRMISKETGATVEFSSETNYMFRLSAFRQVLLNHYRSNERSIHPEPYRLNVIRTLEAETLEDISISRPRSRLTWGIPVPNDPEHTIYVWIDALTSYLTGIGYPWKDRGLSNGWPVDVQVIGKDIIRFHAIYFGAMLTALKLPLARQILTHAHWTSSQKKMSKSLGNTTDPFQAIEEFGVDSIRFYLAKVGGRFRDDVDWSHSQVSKHDKEIQALLGNFFMRITSRKISSLVNEAIASGLNVNDADPNVKDTYRALEQATRALPAKVAEKLDTLELADAIDEIVEVLKLVGCFFSWYFVVLSKFSSFKANKCLTDVAPWSNPSPLVSLLSYTTCLETLRVVGICIQPFTPAVAGRLLDALKIPVEERAWSNASTSSDVLRTVQGVRLFSAKAVV
ncbi:methionyl-tRNA synthetase [Paramarasmius palmivorus]|uniref:Probable methionine--tRNA ligase, mitochondrial n=1 Tax=Paramarasmius palmivorus TaxID=297713 RepID=A0AAW0CFQ7_9AGAR